MHSAETPFLNGLEGSEVTTDAKTSLLLPSRTWVITEKLEEVSLLMDQEEIDDDLGPAFTAAKFLCYCKDDPAKKPVFMRIYSQIPIMGTEFLNYRIRASQAVPPIQLNELMALGTLKKLGCGVVPDLLGYQEGQQGYDGIVPGGFTTSIVWDKVPGEPLSEKYFWSLGYEARDAIRQEFRRVYEQLVLCGVQPRMATSTKLIYDELTGKMHISGFRNAAPIDSNQRWSDTNYVTYGLAERSLRTDWYLDPSGWKWSV